MIHLNLPASYVKFYKGFLNDRHFRVRVRNTLSKSAKESCGSPQGTISSPWLFLIYMEDLLHNLKLYNLYHNIEVGIFTDDLTAFTMEKDLTTLENRLNGLIEKIEKWNKNHNMILSDKKGKCSTILFTNKKNERQPIVLMKNKLLESTKSTKLLEIILDLKLIFIDYFKMLKNETSRRINQLQSVTNCCFGST